MDDISAYAILMIYFEMRGETYEIIRSRDLEIINTGDIVFDVGSEYDPTKNRYDHHQPNKAGARENGIEYSSIGLIWKHFGMEICRDDQKVWSAFDKKIVSAIDAIDNGITLSHPARDDVHELVVSNLLYMYRPTWKEDPNLADLNFQFVADHMKQYIMRYLSVIHDIVEGERKVRECFEKSDNKSIIELDQQYPWYDVLIPLDEPRVVIYPRTDSTWAARCVPSKEEFFHTRVIFPSEWGGLKDESLSKVSGVPNVVFCHVNGFIAVAKTLEGARSLALAAIPNTKIM